MASSQASYGVHANGGSTGLVGGASGTFSGRFAETKDSNPSRQHNAVIPNDSELVGKLRNLTLDSPVTEGPRTAAQR